MSRDAPPKPGWQQDRALLAVLRCNREENGQQPGKQRVAPLQQTAKLTTSRKTNNNQENNECFKTTNRPIHNKQDHHHPLGLGGAGNWMWPHVCGGRVRNLDLPSVAGNLPDAPRAKPRCLADCGCGTKARTERMTDSWRCSVLPCQSHSRRSFTMSSPTLGARKCRPPSDEPEHSVPHAVFAGPLTASRYG